MTSRSIRRSIVLVATGILAFSMSGCAKVDSSYALLAPSTGSASGDVTVIEEGRPVPRGLHEIGLVQAWGIAPDGDRDKVEARLIDQAHALGCSTIAHLHIDTQQGSTAMTGVCLAP